MTMTDSVQLLDLGDALIETRDVGEPIRVDNLSGEKGYF
jgi:hypothetical protein